MSLPSMRFAFRSLARSPGFTLAFVLTLGLGIGASTSETTLFSSRNRSAPKAARIPNSRDRAALLAVVGLVVGALGAIVLSRSLTSLLFGVESNDPLTFVAVGMFLGVVALTASLAPAWRASKTDPAVVLRSE